MFIILTDICVYALPIIASTLWIFNDTPPPVQLVSFANLLLDLKFMLFIRIFRIFGKCFVVILGVARKVFSFLMILLLIILSFAHAFHLLLKPSQIFALDTLTINDDPNNPWNLVNKYVTYFTNNDSYNQDSIVIQQPDGNTNMFTLYSSSLLALYGFLTGNFKI